MYPSAVYYRIPLFTELSKLFTIVFLFTGLCDKRIEGAINNIRCKKLRRIPIPLVSSYGSTKYGAPEIPLDLFPELLHDCFDVFIAKNMNSPASQIAFIVSRMLKRPFILWEETWYLPLTTARKIIAPFALNMLRHSSAIIVPGSKAKEFFISVGVPIERIFEAPNASMRYTRTDKNKVKEIKRKIGLKDDKIVLYLGRLLKYKGIEYLIDAFEMLQKDDKNTVLIIAGDGEHKNMLKDICKNKHIKNVYFMGYVPEDEKNAIYSIANVFVLPSIKTDRTAEVWGLTINEAMSIGLPVICTDAVAAGYDLIQDGFNGFVVREKDSCALYKAIKKILSNETLGTQMGERSKAFINNKFTYGHMADGFVNAIEFVKGDC